MLETPETAIRVYRGTELFGLSSKRRSEHKKTRDKGQILGGAADNRMPRNSIGLSRQRLLSPKGHCGARKVFRDGTEKRKGSYAHLTAPPAITGRSKRKGSVTCRPSETGGTSLTSRGGGGGGVWGDRKTRPNKIHLLDMTRSSGGLGGHVNRTICHGPLGKTSMGRKNQKNNFHHAKAHFFWERRG